MKLSCLEINPNKHIDIQRIWRVPYNGKPYDSLADVAASVIHPFYKKMKKKIDREADHKLWGDSPLPNYLIEYAAIDAYARHLQVVEDNRQHQKRSGNFKRAGSGPLLPLPLCGMRRHQSLPSCCLRLCLSFICCLKFVVCFSWVKPASLCHVCQS